MSLAVTYILLPVEVTSLGESSALTQQLLDVFDALHLLLFVTHHAEGTGTMSNVSNGICHCEIFTLT